VIHNIYLTDTHHPIKNDNSAWALMTIKKYLRVPLRPDQNSYNGSSGHWKVALTKQ
jgi:hypothetical protein